MTLQVAYLLALLLVALAGLRAMAAPAAVSWHRLAGAFHKDRPAALIEDAGVIGALLLVVLAVASLA